MEEKFFTAGDKGKWIEKSLNESYKTIQNSQNGAHYTKGSDRYKNIERNISVRDGFGSSDYDYFRDDEKTDGDHKEIKKKCKRVYRKCGLVKNIVDLMSDFAVQGMRIVHPVSTIQTFHETWADKVNMQHVAERIASNLIRQGCYALDRTNAKLDDNDVSNFKRNLVIGKDLKADTDIPVKESTIPWMYKFLNPCTLDVLGDDLAILSGNIQYGVSISPSLVLRIKAPRTDTDRELIAKTPASIINSIRQGKRVIPLDMSKTVIGHYKKDDYELWADPMIYAVLDDIKMLNKMKLADLCALDGAISNIRLWRLGSLEHKIAPNPAALAKLSDILLNNVAGGTIDLVWGPELDFKETASDHYKFLGNAKYEAVLDAIYAGLGIPPTLTGGAKSAGMTNNYISLKTLLERLNYIRGIILNFFNNELRRIQKAMGFAKTAAIEFDRMTLSDEAAEKALIIQLVDRDIISIETAQERMGENPELEQLRLKKEAKKRKNGKMPVKADPFHDANHEKGLEKIALQGGGIAPSEVGLELKPRKAGEIPVLKQQEKLKEKKLPGVPGQGRPVNKKDSKKRKKKRVLPRTAANMTQGFAWARKTQASIAEYFDKVFVKACNKENMRQLSTDEAESLESLKFGVLCNLKPYQDISCEILEACLDQDLSIPINVQALCKETMDKYIQKYDRQMTLEEVRQTQAMVYVLYKGDLDGEVNA